MVCPSEESRTSSKVTLAPASASMSGSRIVLPFSARNCLPKARKIAYMGCPFAGFGTALAAKNRQGMGLRQGDLSRQSDRKAAIGPGRRTGGVLPLSQTTGAKGRYLLFVLLPMGRSPFALVHATA